MRWFLVLLMLMPAPLLALPNMIRLGYPNCVSCHVTPQGGGLLNAYGRGVDDAQSFAKSEYEPNANRVLTRLSLNGIIDQDFRVVPSMQLTHTPGGPYGTADKLRFFYRNIVTLGKGFRVSTVVNAENQSTTRKARPYEPAIQPGHVTVTTALAQYRPKEGIEFAVGRDSLPTGLNIPDQTTFIKARNRLGYYDTPTQAKAFFWGKRWLAAPYVFAPSGLEPDVARAREKGGGIIGEYDLLGRGNAVFGVNVVRGSSSGGNRLMSGAYTRLGFGSWGVLAEHDVTDRDLSASAGDATFRQDASFVQLFYYPREWLAVSAITERLNVQRPYAEMIWAYKGELSMRLSSKWTIGVRSGAQRDALTGVVSPIASLQLSAKTVN